MSFPENSSPNSVNELQLVGAVQVTVKTVEDVFGAMAPNIAVHALLPLMVPNRVKFHPEAVIATLVGVLLPLFAQETPITTASFALLAKLVNVSVNPLPFVCCCTKTF